jgi:hypothetical protein
MRDCFEQHGTKRCDAGWSTLSPSYEREKRAGSELGAVLSLSSSQMAKLLPPSTAAAMVSTPPATAARYNSIDGTCDSDTPTAASVRPPLFDSAPALLCWERSHTASSARLVSWPGTARLHPHTQGLG